MDWDTFTYRPDMDFIRIVRTPGDRHDPLVELDFDAIGKY